MSAITAASSTRKIAPLNRPQQVLVLFVAWLALGLAFSGKATLPLDASTQTPVQQKLSNWAEKLDANRDSSPLFVYFFNPLRTSIDTFINTIRHIISLPTGNNVIPYLGWAGVVALVGFIVYATSNARTALLAVALLTSCGALGLWTETSETLAMIIGAVILSVIVGLPLGIWAGVSNNFLRFVTPVLDFAQIMPTFVYLTPLTLIFLIGPAAATIATMIYAIPPLIRITAHGIRHVPESVLESATSMGVTNRQILAKVKLPLARETIIVGLNQCVMAALSMVTIAAFIDAPGLGKTILLALQTLDIGLGFTSGLAIVFLAIMLDRSASASGRRARSFVPPTPTQIKQRRIGLGAAAAATVTCAVLSRQVMTFAVFPSQVNVGPTVARVTNNALTWATDHLYFLTNGFQEFITRAAINPIEAQLSNTPWFITVAALTTLGLILGGLLLAVTTAGCFLAIVGLGLWQDSMLTLAQVLVATLLTMIIGIALGVAVGRSSKVDAFMRPLLDAGQTLPAFVYMVPLLALFGATRFTAIMAAVVYASPIVVKLVAEGIRTVPVTMIESSTASGATSWQMITKVQLPASRKSLALGVNQGLIYVLAMVVVGGLVGGQALGYDVVNGFAQMTLRGKGLAAGLAIVFMGIALDRLSAFGQRTGRPEERI